MNKPMRYTLRALSLLLSYPGEPVRSVLPELVGGDETEEYHCPRLEWDWGDGTRSERESDCEPYDGVTPVERRYSARHVYRSPGQYDIRLTLRRASRVVAVGTTAVAVQGGPGADAY